MPQTSSSASPDGDASRSGLTPAPRLTLARGDHPETDLEVKRSHFLARAARTDTEEEARAFIASVRSAHADARHHCSAFTVPVDGALPVERSSDDGEPSGTAGQPILEVLRGSGLTATTVVVTRYFGGTLLGTGGLVRAYSAAAREALAAARQVRIVSRDVWDVRVPVADAGRLEAELRGLAGGAGAGIDVEETIWGATHAVLLVTTGDADDAALLAQAVAELTQGGTAPEPAGSRLGELPA